MNDKRIIFTEEELEKKHTIDVRVNNQPVVNKPVNINNSMAYEMYQKYQNISLEKNHVLTLRRTK